MTLTVGDYIDRRRDSVWERDLADKLRKIPERDRLKFISDLATVNTLVALVLAGKCLQERSSFVKLLDQALESADASGIRYWLEALVPRMGIRKVLKHLRDRAASHAVAVSKAAYWLPNYERMPGYSWEDVEALQSV